MEEFLHQYAYLSLWGLLLALCFWITYSKNLIVCVALLAIFSLIVAGLFTYMQAPDVAITEAAIGAALSTIFYLIGVFIVGKEEKNKPRMPILNAIMCILLVLLSINLVKDLPTVGSAESPANSNVAKHYIDNTYKEVGVQNIVTAVLASYRGFDTLGEVFVIFAAGVAVTMLLGTMRSRPRKREKAKERLKKIKASKSVAIKTASIKPSKTKAGKTSTGKVKAKPSKTKALKAKKA